MSADEVLKLADLGFTVEEIRGMMAKAPEGTTPVDTPAETTPAETPEENKDKETAGADISELTDTIKELKNTVKEMQAANIDKAKGGKSDYEKSIADTIKSFTETL